MAVSVGALEVRNFRSCRDLAVVLSAYTPIVGRNNCGKSNVVAALSWLIRRSTLSEDYFNQVDRHLEVAGTLVGIQQADIDTLPDPKHQAAIAKYVQDGTLHIKRVQATPKIAPKLAVKDPETGEWVDNPTGHRRRLECALPRAYPHRGYGGCR